MRVQSPRSEMPHRRSRMRALLCSATLALVATASTAARAENMMARFMRIDPEPVSDKKGTPLIPMLVDISTLVPINSFTENCSAQANSGNGAKLSKSIITCMSTRIERDGYAKSLAEFPRENAQVFATVDGKLNPMEIVDATSFKDATANNAGIAWLLLLDASSSIGSRWPEMQRVATEIIRAMGERDAVQVRIMDDRATRERTKWLAASGKDAATRLIAKITQTYKSTTRADALIDRLEKEAVGSFQQLFADGVEDSDATPLVQTIVLLSDGGDSTAEGFVGGTKAQMLHEKLVRGELIEGTRLPVPVVSIWFPKDEWVGTIAETYRGNEYQWMSNIATPEVGGFFDIVQDGELQKGGPIARKVRERFDNMHYLSVRASCLDTSGEQKFKIIFKDSKPRIVPDTWEKLSISFNPTKWLLDVDRKQSQESANKHPLMPGETFDVFGDFCWGSDRGAAEAYFVTEADAAAVKKAAASKTPSAVKSLLQGLAAKGQKAETVEASPIMGRFRVPNTPALFENKPDAFSLNVVILDTKAARASAQDKSGLLVLRAQHPPLNKLIVVGAIGGGVVLILLIAILARSGGGRSKRRRGGGPPAPAPMPGRPPGSAEAPQGLGAYPPAAAPTAPSPYAGAGANAYHQAAAPGAIEATAFAQPVPVGVPAYAAPPAHAAAPPAYAPPPMHAAAPPAYAPPPVHAAAPPAYAPPPVYAAAPPAYAPPPAVAAAAGHGAQWTAPLPKGATSHSTSCPSCGQAVLVSPGSSAQCVFCGALVGAAGEVMAPAERPANQFGLTARASAGAIAEIDAHRPAQERSSSHGAPSSHASEQGGSAGRGSAAEPGSYGSYGSNRPGSGTLALQQPTGLVRAAVLEGDSGTFRILDGIESRVGRDGALCSIVLTEPRVSSGHASLKLEQGTLFVRDDRSHNGTHLNGNRLAPGSWTPVPFGSQLRFGPAEFHVRPEP